MTIACSKRDSRPSRHGRRGSVLVVALVSTVVLALLGVTLAQIVCDEQQISANSTDAEEALYLAEAGVADVVWRIAHDSTWTVGFDTGLGWTQQITRTAANGLRPNRGYQTTVVGQERGSATVTSTGTIARSGGFARRMIRAHIAKGYTLPPYSTLSAIMASGWDTGNGQFENGNIEIAAKATITGSVLANNQLIVQTRSKKGVDISTAPVIWDSNTGQWVQGAANPSPDNVTGLAVDSLDISQAAIWVDKKFVDSSYDGTASTFTMPSLDFDYLRQQADYYYTGDELFNMLKAGDVTLTGVVFIEGDVEIPSSRSLTINGLLVATGNLEMLGESSSLAIYRNPNADEWQYSCGIICRGNISLQGDYYIEGLVYSLGTINLKGEKPGAIRKIHGCVAGRQVLVKGREEIVITLDTTSREWVEVVLRQAGGLSGEPTTLRVDAWNEIY